MLKSVQLFCLSSTLFFSSVFAEETVVENSEKIAPKAVKVSNFIEGDVKEPDNILRVEEEGLSVEAIIEQQKKQQIQAEKAKQRLQTMVQFCAPCHGTNGISTFDIYPVLAGQKFEYILKQLQDFKNNRRENVVMQGLVSGLTEDEMKAIAQYYANHDQFGNIIEVEERGSDENL